jgi:arginine-tRNA-protein transferase
LVAGSWKVLDPASIDLPPVDLAIQGRRGPLRP